MNRRKFIASVAATSAIGAFSGCTGGSDSNNSSSANSSSGNSSNQATTMSAKEAIKSVSFEGGKMFVEVGDTIRRVRLINPNGQKLASSKVGSGETSAKLTLVSSNNTGVMGYQPGTWKAYADTKTNGSYSEYAWRNLNLQPSFKAISFGKVGADGPAGRDQQLTFKNVGTAPGAIDAARLYARSYQPGSNTWAYPEEPIAAPGETVTVNTGLQGFSDQYSLDQDQNVTAVSNEYCTGEARPVYVEYKMMSDEPTREKRKVVFSGKVKEASAPGQATCSKLSFQNSSGSSTSTNNQG
ncbi:hypothetical protein [Halococcus sp. IIIV-5B]|uniref:hypothetical protein n=1 Tax=Halococcus sp. IIIV-5B TaxID=2321230 RepID=UPI000E7173BD|nr:hypothetical protein [Halococcus sp. IIIV-5B]RJT04730.1 hypothetical protein D3261_08965 [Halococcus sp. IIIV-5B]